jgi:hypothetical protein
MFFAFALKKTDLNGEKIKKSYLSDKKLKRRGGDACNFFFSSIMCHTHFLLCHFQQQQKNDKNDERFSFLNNGCCDK